MHDVHKNELICRLVREFNNEYHICMQWQRSLELLSIEELENLLKGDDLI